MTNKQKEYGKIEEGFILRESIGDGDIFVNGSTLKFALSYSVVDREPMVTFGGRHFILSWDEIAELAERAGLFDGEGAE